MKDVLQLAAVIVMASRAKKKNVRLQKFKNNKKIRMKSYSDILLLKLMMRSESLYEKTRSVENISSEYTYFLSWIEEESGVFDT